MQPQKEPFPSPPRVGWKGAHHLALATGDLDGTVRFYHGVLGMALFGAKGPEGRHGRHCYFKAGSLVIHFFEGPTSLNPPLDPAWRSGELVLLPGPYQHLAVAMETLDELIRLRDRLITEGVAVTPLGAEGPIRHFRFVDNNGVMLEAVWSPIDQAAAVVDYDNPGLFQEHDYVPAVQEILAWARVPREPDQT